MGSLFAALTAGATPNIIPTAKAIIKAKSGFDMTKMPLHIDAGGKYKLCRDSPNAANQAKVA